YGYEEAIGYCVLPEVGRDKDGLSAALMVAEMAAEAKAAGTTLVGRLDELARRDGLHATSQLSIRVEDLSLIDEMMQRLRLSPPTELIGSPVTSMQDLSQGSVATTGLPPTDGVALLSADDTRVVVRPSGTEPKLKCYLEVVEHIPAGGPRGAMAELRERAGERLEQLTQERRRGLGRGWARPGPGSALGPGVSTRCRWRPRGWPSRRTGPGARHRRRPSPRRPPGCGCPRRP